MEFIDLKKQYQVIKDEIDANIQSVINHGHFIMGPEVGKFENELAAFVGRKHCISCANGTDALQLLYMSYGVGSGDAVFCSDITFFASIEPALMLGATPVFCDIDKRTYNISTKSLRCQIENVISENKLRPKIVVAVDIFGNPCDYASLQSICDEYNLILIEDAAQSIGASYNGIKCGAFGEGATTSFFPVKPLGCYGDGGAIFTNSDETQELLQSLRVHGRSRDDKYNNIRVGVNSRLDTMQAAILLPKLRILNEFEIEARQQIATYYNEAFMGKLATPFVEEGCISIYSQYILLAKDMEERDYIINYLKGNNIPCMIYYPMPQHSLPVFDQLNMYSENYQNAINYCARTFSLPMYPYLLKEDQDKVINTVLGALNGA